MEEEKKVGGREKKAGSKEKIKNKKEIKSRKESKDRAQKNLEAFQDVAADIINALYYGGKEVVKEKTLIPAATETLYLSADGVLRSQIEDISKLEIEREKVKALYYIANQTDCDSGMILRKAGYVGAAYREQYDGKMKDVYYPVNEFVLYWGEKRWTAVNSLKEFLLAKEVDQERVAPIDEIGLNVYEMRHLSREVRERFQSDMRIVVDYLAEGNSYNSDREIVHTEALIRMIMALSGDTDIDNMEKILKDINVGKEEKIKVCELFEQYVRKGRQEGRQEGMRFLILDNLEEGKTEEIIIKKLMKGYSLGQEEAKHYYDQCIVGFH